MAQHCRWPRPPGLVSLRTLRSHSLLLLLLCGPSDETPGLQGMAGATSTAGTQQPRVKLIHFRNFKANLQSSSVGSQGAALNLGAFCWFFSPLLSLWLQGGTDQQKEKFPSPELKALPHPSPDPHSPTCSSLIACQIFQRTLNDFFFSSHSNCIYFENTPKAEVQTF